MYPLALWTLTFFLGLLPFSETSAATQARPPGRASEDNLTEEFARFRKSQVRSVSYDLSFVLTPKSEEFSGEAELNLDLSRVDAHLSIDTTAKKIHSVWVNGIEVKDFVSRTGSIDIPSKYLTPLSKIKITFQGVFSKDGHGFQRAIDPEDGAEYLYSDSEPYYAHTLFPCLDQPDLKATYKVTVQAPKDWKVISNDLITESKTTNNITVTRFAPTKPISTYLFFLGAGPFVEWTDMADKTPLTLYARKALAKYVDHKNIFETTKKGLDFFSNYFGHPYPFPKYGQIFIPEFAWGGMENPGAVTLNERNIFRGAVPQAKYEDRNDLILHEMAHMWFGDLVTMSWWNDLWLNESFASYLAYLAQERALKAQGVALDFFNSKTWGYWQDELVTTHPIETPVTDVRSSKGNFDGITYAKGAASLKQLHFFVGEEGFREGLRSYFKKHAFKNTVREDFISEIAAASKKDLRSWTAAWLKTAGPNRVQTKWSCKENLIQSFEVIQQPSVSGTLSPHRTRIGLFKTGTPMQLLKIQDVAYSAKSTNVPELKGVPCPDFVYPNVDDQDYALFALDPESLKNSKDALTNLQDPLLRLMLWRTLGQMVRDSQLSLSQYFEFAKVGLEREDNDPLLAAMLGSYSQIRQFTFQYLKLDDRRRILPELEELIWRRLTNSSPESSAQMTFFDFYSSIAQSEEAMARLNGMLGGKNIPKGLKIDQDRRWNVIGALASTNFPGVSALIDAEEKTDPSTKGKRTAYGARASIPTMDTKQKFWAEFQKPEAMPFSHLRAATSSFHNSARPDTSETFVEPIFKNILNMDWKSNDSLVDIYFEGLFPQNICSSQLLAKSKTKMASAKNLTPLAKRAWLEANDELSRCVAVRKHQVGHPKL